jgi:hypothetical protein
MPVYIVESQSPPDTAGLSRPEIGPFLKEKLADVVRLIDDFNRQAGNDAVTVTETAWINGSVRIEASEQAAQNLARTTGLSVSPPRTLQRD